MKKKGWMRGAVIGLVFICLMPMTVYGEEQTNEVSVGIEASHGILMETTTGLVLYEKDAHVAVPPASVTKIMTMLLIFEALEAQKIKLEDLVVISEKAASMGGSQVFLEPNEQQTVDALLKCIAIASANDAIVVFAEQLGSTEEGFVHMMNQRAEDMGLSNTHFVNATGFDEENHYTSARDVAKMALELQKYPEMLSYARVWMDSLRNGETMLVNTNRLVRFYQGTTGLKTGTTDAAGQCLCATAERNELKLCAVVLGCKSSDGRFEAAKTLLDHGFSTYCVYTPEEVSLEPLKVIHGTAEQVELFADVPQQLVIHREDVQNLVAEVPELEAREAPLKAGEEVGIVRLLSGEKEIAVYPIKTRQQIEALNFGKCFSLLMRECVSMVKNGKEKLF